MGVERTDYLMWGVEIDPALVKSMYDLLEAEIYGDETKRFDLIYDAMSGKYAFAGHIITKSDAHDGLGFKVISQDDLAWRPEVVASVREVFPHVGGFELIMFSHFS